MLPEIFKSHPSGSSMHQAIHFMQHYISGRFRQYDYGSNENMKRYNQTTPPDYNLDNINPRFPIHFYYSAYDTYSAKADVERISEVLGNRSVNHFIDLKDFAHIDFIWADNVKDVINWQVLKIMNEAEEILSKDLENNLDIEVR